MDNKTAYKITVDCTNTNVFSFRDKKITKEIYPEIHTQLDPIQFDFIDRINILHKEAKKSKRGFTFKNFEVLCNKINEEQFVDFIKRMKEVGFTTKNNCHIYMLDNKGNFVYTYDFNECDKLLDNPERKEKTNNWNYKTQSLYKK
jgi:hypothetical protein